MIGALGKKMKQCEKIKAERSELAPLRQRVNVLSFRLKAVFSYHIFCICVFVLYIFLVAKGASLANANAAAPIMLGFAALIAILPVLILIILSYSKNKKATKALIALSFVFFVITLAETTVNELSFFTGTSATIIGVPSAVLLIPCYALAFICLIIYKNKRNTLSVCIISLAVYCILCLSGEIQNIVYPHILFVFSAILNIIALEYISEYENLSKIYGFPYFNERFNEQTGEYTPMYHTSDSVSHTIDLADVQAEEYFPDSPCAKCENLMETVDIATNCDNVCDVPISEKIKVDEYTQKLRSLKHKK